MRYLFGTYVLDTQRYELHRAGEPIKLRRKVFQVLAYLLAHRERVVPKLELLEHVWPDQFVGDEALKSCIKILRRALGERGRTPHFVRTLHGQGYRFVAAVAVQEHLAAGMTTPPSGSAPSAVHSAVPSVGREAELTRLHAWLATALRGVRQVGFVTGEAGLGKTTLVEAFVAELGNHGPLWIGRGQCVEHYGPGEPYLPVLEALGRVCRGPGGQEVVALLGQQAPTWLVQMPGLVRAADLETLQRRVVGATRERMLRELAETLDLLTVQQPLVLVLEDLHWSDPSTLDLLAVLARRREPARLLLLGTYRLPDALQRGHPLHTVHHELQRHGQCTELPLPLLSEAAVVIYLTTRFPDARLPAGLARLVHQHTEGNPLFMVTVVEEWVRRGWLVPADGEWTLRVGLAAVASTMPESLRQMLEQQLERLSPMDQRVLEAGSVAGATFSAAAVAAGLGHEVVEVEDWCAGLARRQQWLEACGEQVWPDGTVAGGYRFMHALYQKVAYHRLPAARRVQLHRRIGERDEAGYGSQVRERAAVLAMHFERGRDYQRAVRYLQHAADNALHRSAYTDAITHLTRALVLLSALPETPERAQRELDVQLALGPAFVATKGMAALEVEQTYARARTLCEQVGETPQILSTLRDLSTFYSNRGALLTARELKEQWLRLVQREAAPTHRMIAQAHISLGVTLFFLGEHAAAQAHFEQGSALTDLTAQRTLALRRSGVLRVRCLAYAACTLWYLGYPAQALRRSQAAQAQAQELAQPYNLANVRNFAAFLHYLRRDASAVQTEADALLSLATAQGFPLYEEAGRMWRGWALAMQGEGEVGLAQLRQSLAAIVALEQELSRPLLLILLAEAVGHTGQVEEGLRLLAEALTAFEASGRADVLAGAYRLQGALLLWQDVPDARQAEACFQQALAVARRQQAKSLELRAAMSLSRLWQQQGKRDAARQLLGEVYGWFTEGFDTTDLQEAQILLEELRVVGVELSAVGASQPRRFPGAANRIA